MSLLRVSHFVPTGNSKCATCAKTTSETANKSSPSWLSTLRATKAFLRWEADRSISTVRNTEIYKVVKSRVNDADEAELGHDIKLLLDSVCLATSTRDRFSRLGSALPSHLLCAVDVAKCNRSGSRRPVPLEETMLRHVIERM